MSDPADWPELGTRIENVGPGPFEDDREVFLCSIAVSLKRIADSMERTALAIGGGANEAISDDIDQPEDDTGRPTVETFVDGIRHPAHRKSTWSPSYGLNGMDLWYVDHGGEPHKIEDRDSFLKAIEKSVPLVAAFFNSDAKRLLDDPEHSSGEPVTFEFEGASFTIPCNPIPF